jgi:hypothetical protein
VVQQPDWYRADDVVRGMTGATGHDDGRAGGLGGGPGDEQAAERGTLIAAQLLGLALCRYILRFEPLASLPAAEVVASVAPSVQRYLS